MDQLATAERRSSSGHRWPGARTRCISGRIRPNAGGAPPDRIDFRRGGIGKTRCAQALADVAEDQGALVLRGHCREDAGAPPYWPWVQILRAYVDASSLDEVRLNMGAAAKDIAALVPELLELSQPAQPAPGAWRIRARRDFAPSMPFDNFFTRPHSKFP